MQLGAGLKLVQPLGNFGVNLDFGPLARAMEELSNIVVSTQKTVR